MTIGDVTDAFAIGLSTNIRKCFEIFRSFRDIQKILRYLENLRIFRNIHSLFWLFLAIS